VQAVGVDGHRETLVGADEQHETPLIADPAQADRRCKPIVGPKTAEDHGGPDWQPARTLVVTARREGAVVGAATGVLRDREAHFERLLVDGSVRGEGVGGHLLAAFTSEAVADGASRIVLRTLAGDAARFYVDRGFRPVAVLPGWRRGADFVLLERPVAGGR